jgi:allantoin racemase
VAGIRTIDIASSAEYLAAEKMDARIIAEANALAVDGADAVVICGAAMAGVARRLKPAVSVPLIDGVTSAVAQAEALVGAGFRPSAPLNPAQTAGLSPELAALFGRA